MARTVDGTFIEKQRKALRQAEDEKAYRERETADCALADRPPITLNSDSSG